VVTSLVPSTFSIIFLKSSPIAFKVSKSSPLILMLIAPAVNPSIIVDDSETLISAPGISLVIILISSLISFALLSLSSKSLNNTIIEPLPPEPPIPYIFPPPAEVNTSSISGISVIVSCISFNTASISCVSEPAGRLTLTLIIPSSPAGKNSAPTDITIITLTTNKAILINIVIKRCFKL
jgi:hypothetical protein